MFELLNPRRVAARKLARIIAQKQFSGPTPERGGQVEPAVGGREFDSLERLLEQELAKYGISLV